MALLTVAELQALLELLKNGPCALSPPPCRVGIVHGEVADDSCEKNLQTGADGQLTISLMNVITLYDDSPKCGEERTRFLIRLVRCAPGMDDQGNPPKPEVLEASAIALRADGDALYRAVTCCWLPRAALSSVTLTPYGPAGGCAGWTLEVEVSDRACC